MGFNQALIAKQVWRIMTCPLSLASKVLKSIYFPNTSIMNAVLGNNPLYQWKSFLWGRDLLKMGFRYRIGNGETIRVFKDPWIPRVYTFKPTTVNEDFIEVRAAFFMDVEGKWDTNKLGAVFDKEDINLIMRMPTKKNLEDKWIWHFDKKGLYSVKSGYKAYINTIIRESSSSENNMQKTWEKLWRLKVPNKVKSFCWRALHEIIPTKVNLQKKGIDTNLICPICNCFLESSDHVLFTYSRAKSVWNSLNLKGIYNSNFQNSIWDRWSFLGLNRSDEEMGLIPLTSWEIWNDRNNLNVGKQIPNCHLRCYWIAKYLDDYLSQTAKGRGGTSSWPSIPIDS